MNFNVTLYIYIIKSIYMKSWYICCFNL